MTSHRRLLIDANRRRGSGGGGGGGPTTFGKNTIGGTAEVIVADYKQVSKFVLDSSMTPTKLVIYLANPGGSSQVLKGVIYAADGSGGEPGTRLAVSNEVTLTAGQSAGWVDFTIASPPSLTAANYHLGFIAGGTTVMGRFYQDTVGLIQRRYSTNTYGSGPTDPFGTASGSDNMEISVYASA